MALSAPQQDMVSRMAQMLDWLLDNEGEINRFDILYSDTPNWDTDITQDEINEVASFAAIGLTTTDIATALYVLKQVRTQVLTIDLPAVVKVATLA